MTIHDRHRLPDPSLHQHPRCWCGEPARFISPAEPDLFPTTTHMLDQSPGYFTCLEHTHSDYAQAIGH